MANSHEVIVKFDGWDYQQLGSCSRREIRTLEQQVRYIVRQYLQKQNQELEKMDNELTDGQD